MKIIKIYHNTLEDESIVNSFAHPLGAEGSYTLSYWLIADKDKTLRHKKSLVRRKSIKIPSYQLNDWEEVAITH